MLPKLHVIVKDISQYRSHQMRNCFKRLIARLN